jgi:hypothetical protein
VIGSLANVFGALGMPPIEAPLWNPKTLPTPILVIYVSIYSQNAILKIKSAKIKWFLRLLIARI